MVEGEGREGEVPVIVVVLSSDANFSHSQN
jgi:hypothetical protein